MNQEEIIAQTKNYVQQSSPGDQAHDWWHIYHVHRLALRLSEKRKKLSFMWWN